MRSTPPAERYLRADHVIDAMASFGRDRVHHLGPLRVLVLGGGFITIGGLLSVLLAAGIESPGLQRLVEGFAFSAGFFFVVLSEAVLFTEANVVLPATFSGRIARVAGSQGSGPSPGSATSRAQSSPPT